MKIISILAIFLVACAHVESKSNRAPASDWDWSKALQVFDAKNDAPKFNHSAGFGDWAPCLDKNNAYKPYKADATGKILPACLPDTLYTWGPYDKLLSFLKYAGPLRPAWDEPFNMAVYSFINPLVTFGYGEVAIRIKLKKDSKFILRVSNNLVTCADIPRESWNDSVLVYSWANSTNTGVDYILCSPGPIASWSVATQRHYDEIAASQNWNNGAIAAGSNKEWIQYTMLNGAPELYFNGDGLDNHNWSQGTMLTYLKHMHESASEGLSLIVYAPGVAHDESEHFSSRFKVYWHWNDVSK